MTDPSRRFSGPWLLFLACVLIGLLNEVSGGVLTVALPKLKDDLGASQTGAGLILTTSKLFTIAAGLLLAAAGSAVLAVVLRPDTPYLLLSLVLLGAGNIAVLGPAQELLLGSVP